jgi:hypothetical protein
MLRRLAVVYQLITGANTDLRTQGPRFTGSMVHSNSIYPYLSTALSVVSFGIVEIPQAEPKTLSHSTTTRLTFSKNPKSPSGSYPPIHLCIFAILTNFKATQKLCLAQNGHGLVVTRTYTPTRKARRYRRVKTESRLLDRKDAYNRYSERNHQSQNRGRSRQNVHSPPPSSPKPNMTNTPRPF